MSRGSHSAHAARRTLRELRGFGDLLVFPRRDPPATALLIWRKWPP